MVNSLAFCSIALGLANHLYWKRYERDLTTISNVASSLLPQPALLVLVTGNGFTITSILISYTIFLLTMGISIFLYRISPFHPLAEVPGPWLARVTKLWSFYIATTGDLQRVMKQWHDKYGPTIRTGPNEVSFIGSEAIASVYGPNGLPRGKYYTIRIEPNRPPNLLFLTGQNHFRRRQRWNRAFSAESLKNYEEIISRQAGELLAVFDQAAENGERVNLAKKFTHYTFDIMGEMSFGKKFEMIKTNDAAGYLKFMLEFTSTVNTLPWLPWMFDLKILSFLPFVANAKEKMFAFARECASSRVQEGAAIKDIWYHLMDESEKEQEKPSIVEVIEDGVLAIIAGTESPASALSSTVYFIVQHPEVYKTLQKEIDEDFARNSEIRGELTYLSACISEALRLHPPTPSGGPREVPYGSGGKVVSGKFLPEGTQVIVPLYSIHRNPENFPDPDKYLPQRWLSTEEFDLKHKPEAFIPYSYGQASCVGRGFAQKEMMFILAELFHRYELRFADGFDVAGWEHTIKDFFTTSQGPLDIIFTARH
ncbi:hypothetical protein GYMLUDRAFT_46634 [Collybiopsis luxurians FD-317 M1]|uniref:Cytochrome P450 n=1 Tax=Collybiopsis luxurians FD-317 M1 TaxID=944289 RepID=A0A0D0CFZ8_9AGAR|nr:hypothetical protein GYMLUDRAFT_46634 [Collybiopsis luxurians FD-317 M1]